MKFNSFRFSFILAAALALAILPSRAANLLVNPGFEANSGHTLPLGWKYFSGPTNVGYFGDYWIEGNAGPHSGSFYWKEWGALYLPAPTNNVAGIYQDFSSAPGSTYSASGFFYISSSDVLGPDCYVWLEVSFLGANTNLLALYKSDNFSASVGLATWFPYQVTHACDLSSPVSTGDPYFTTYAPTGTVSQLVAPVGTTTVRYRFAYLQAGNEGGSCFLDDAVLNQISGPIPPVISNVFPLNMILVNPNDGISFTASSPSGFTINNNAIHVVLNGADISSSLTISGSSSNKTVSYHGLQSNLVYTASITVTDAFGFTASANTYFETTWLGIPPVVRIWEAEDFDFTNGMYINNPALCSASGDPNCYFGKVGVEGVDEHNSGTSPSHVYRPDDAMGTLAAGDYTRKELAAANRIDYRVDPFNFGDWMNYTRDWSNSTYWVIGRLSTDVGLSGQLTLSVVNPDTSTTDLGTFTIANGRGWSSFDNVFLRDTNGNIANVTLNGKVTLRITSGGNLLPNFFMVAIAQVDLPVLTKLYPTGTHPFEPTNALSFSVTTTGATFPANGIKLNLDGTDVSALLQLTGSSSQKNVVYPGLLSNAMHVAIITVTNSLGHGISVTNHFDTFSQANYMVESEDYDYDGGQYITDANWYPDAYAGLGATTNIDFQHTAIGGEPPFGLYRSDGIPEELAFDFTRDAFIGQYDYHLAWYGPGDWANYTRGYPAGAYYIYNRSAGLGPFTMYLDKVVSGAGTVNQVTQRLGQWSSIGLNNQTHQWIPLTDDGLVSPAIVKLSGVSTLRLSTSTGNCYPSFLMLVPAASINLSAFLSGGNVIISFPTTSGVVYRVFYRNNLLTGTWNFLTNISGDGTVKTVSDPATGTQRFYKVVAP